jgi:uncharacterized membrane protein
MLPKILLILAGVSTAIMAGLFFAWSFSVMPGLAKLSDREFIAAMQSMNRAIQNPVFFIFFFGATVFLPLATVFNYRSGTIFGFLLAAAIIYLIGVMGVTFLGNIPLNNALDAFRLDGSTAQEIFQQRTQFENPWVRLNYVRTLSSFISIVLLIIACVWRSEN